jgi:hypothetical protein
VSGIGLFAGERSDWLEHPGLPVQEALALTLAADWLVTRSGESRHARAEQWTRDLDRVVPQARFLALLLFASAAAAVFVALALTFRNPAWAAAGTAAFVALPTLVVVTPFLRPDALLSAAVLGVCALAATSVRRRRPDLLAAAAAVAGFAVSVKIQAVALALPLALATALLRREPLTFRPLWAWARRHRRALGAAAAAWTVLCVVTNATAQAPESRELVRLVLAGAAAGALLAVSWLVLRRTRLRRLGDIGAAIALAAVCGFVVPNAPYATTLPELARDTLANLTGSGVNTGIEPFSGALLPPRPWLPLVAVAALGLLRALRAGEREALLWAAAGLGLGLLGAARLGLIHYYAPALAALIPLVLRAFGPPQRMRPWLVAGGTAALIALPLRSGFAEQRGYERLAAASAAANDWAVGHLRAGEVAVTTESDQTGFFYPRAFSSWDVPVDTRLLPATTAGIDFAREHGLAIKYVIVGGAAADSALAKRDLGADRLRAVPGAPQVFEVAG